MRNSKFMNTIEFKILVILVSTWIVVQARPHAHPRKIKEIFLKWDTKHGSWAEKCSIFRIHLKHESRVSNLRVIASPVIYWQIHAIPHSCTEFRATEFRLETLHISRFRFTLYDSRIRAKFFWFLKFFHPDEREMSSSFLWTLKILITVYFLKF